MKLRILDDSLRLRLPQSEVKQLRETGRVEASIRFGPGPEQRLTYALVVVPRAQRISATLTDRDVVVHLPQELAHAWADGDQISLKGEQSLGEGTLSLLIEKDFKCLTPREGEQEYDGFANPNSSC